MAKKQPSLLNEVLEKAVRKKPGFPTWFERLPPDAKAELEAVRAAFDPALHQKRAYARAIVAALTERGWPVAQEQAVIAWLNARP